MWSASKQSRRATETDATLRRQHTRAKARHILVGSEQVAEDLKQDIEGGADFGEIAREHSLCPSGAKGGDVDEFGEGQMVPEFDAVVFSAELGKPHGPVKTQFVYHLIEITRRTD